MWSYAILLWELAAREVPFADMSPMEIGMKVRSRLQRIICFISLFNFSCLSNC